MKETGLHGNSRDCGWVLTRLDSLCSGWFIAALALLLLNDYYLKATFHNWITGKLSDFAGLFVLSIFLVTVWPERKGFIAVLAGFAFLFWKSSLSQPAIDWWNALPLMKVARTVDYTDLMAISILPIALSLKSSFRLPRLSGIAPVVLLAVTLFAILGTSRAVKQSYHPNVPPQYVFMEPPNSLVRKMKEQFEGRIQVAVPAIVDLGPPPPGKYDASYYAQFSHITFMGGDSRKFNTRFLVLPDSLGERTILVLHEVVEYGDGKGQDDLRMFFQEYVISKLKADNH